VDSTSHLHTLYCKRFVRLRVLFKTHISNPTRTLPNQVSYLKGSSMESFTLELTSKIDFRCSTATAHLKRLQWKYYVYEQLWNSISNSCSSQCPGASIYRLGAQMSVMQNILGRRPDNGHGSPGRTTVRQDFSKISRGNLSCLRASSGRDGTSSGQSHVCYK
jgi:hypothetical protein